MIQWLILDEYFLAHQCLDVIILLKRKLCSCDTIEYRKSNEYFSTVFYSARVGAVEENIDLVK
jgi:hypothetical protein